MLRSAIICPQVTQAFNDRYQALKEQDENPSPENYQRTVPLGEKLSTLNDECNKAKEDEYKARAAAPAPK